MNKKIQISLMFAVKMIAFLCMSGLAANTALADTLVLEPAKDNTLYEDPTGRFSNGAGQYLFIGRTGSQNGIPASARRALMSFDLSGIPVGSQITSAELQVLINKVPPQAGGGVASLHYVDRDWGEGASNAPGPEGQGSAAAPGDATWVHRFFDTDNWTSPGGDYNATASQTAFLSSVPETVTFASNAGTISDVQSWVDMPASNFGWIMLGDEAAVENARRLVSRESTDAAERPQLTIEFIPAIVPPIVTVPVPTTSWWGLLLLVGLMLSVAWRRYY